MTPPTVQFIPAADSFSKLISGSTTSSTTTNYYVTHTNIDGDPIWDGRSPTTSLFIVNTSNQFQFFFSSDADRSLALASYSTWKITGTDGFDETITPSTSSNSRLVWQMSSGYSALTTYTLQGQP